MVPSVAGQRLVGGFLFLGLMLTSIDEAAVYAQTTTSLLWGINGELWNRGSSLLYDFTNAGYKLGDEPLPDYPVDVSVTDFGANPNDDVSDVEAFRDAIAACQPYHAVLVPNGRYFIDEAIVLTETFGDKIVIRGESRDGAILFFPKHMGEINGEPTAPASDKFINFFGGSERGLEDLSLVLRDEQKATGYYLDPTKTKQNAAHWFYSGEALVRFSSGEEDSWMRNVYLKNANHAISIGGISTKRISLIDLVLDSFINRKSFADNAVGHMGIHVGSGARNCLVHNILFTGEWSHDLAIMGTQNSVFSRIRGPNLELDHHARGNSFNVFTEIDTGLGGRGYGESSNNFQETYWGIKGLREGRLFSSSRKCTFVGININQNNSIGVDWHHEPLDPTTLAPANIYLAQMELTMGKHPPLDFDLTLPPEPYEDKVFKVLPTDDSYYDKFKQDKFYGFSGSLALKKSRREGFMKFDLSDIQAQHQSVTHAKLKLYTRISLKTTFNLQVRNMSDTSWDEQTLTYSTLPSTTDATIISETFLTKTDIPDWAWVEIDVTDTVNEVLASSDSVLSLNFRGGGTGHNKDSGLSISTRDGANPTHLVVYVVPSYKVSELVATEDSFYDKWGKAGKLFGSYKYVLAKKSRREGFMKFDLSGISPPQTAILKLYGKITLKNRFNLQIYNMTNTTWSEDTLTYSNRPSGDSDLVGEVYTESLDLDLYEFPFTEVVQNVLDSGESIMSLNFRGGGTNHNKDAIFVVQSKDNSEYLPVLEVTTVADFSAPAAPTGLTATMDAAGTSVSLEWEETSSGLGGPVTYNVYRLDDSGYEVKAMGLVTSEYTDYRLTAGNDFPLPVTYVVTAVDIAGGESDQSSSVSANSSV